MCCKSLKIVNISCVNWKKTRYFKRILYGTEYKIKQTVYPKKTVFPIWDLRG